MVAADWTKDSDAVLDWKFDWSLWLATSEIITASVMSATTGITIDSNSFTNTVATVWLSGGTPGIPYTVANRITTNQGRTDERSITIRVANR